MWCGVCAEAQGSNLIRGYFIQHFNLHPVHLSMCFIQPFHGTFDMAIVCCFVSYVCQALYSNLIMTIISSTFQLNIFILFGWLSSIFFLYSFCVFISIFLFSYGWHEVHESECLTTFFFLLLYYIYLIIDSSHSVHLADGWLVGMLVWLTNKM